MDILFEFLGEALVEILFSIENSKKVPSISRVIAAGVITLFLLFIILGICGLGVFLLLNKDIIVGGILLVVGLFLLFSCVNKFLSIVKKRGN